MSQVETELKKQINSAGETQKFVNEITNHFFNAPGRRIRPALVLLSAKSINRHNQLIHLATAVELIYSASLIHDDIVDNALHRRDQPSPNKQVGNQIAVLAGDMLYA